MESNDEINKWGYIYTIVVGFDIIFIQTIWALIRIKII